MIRKRVIGNISAPKLLFVEERTRPLAQPSHTLTEMLARAYLLGLSDAVSATQPTGEGSQ